MAQLLPIFPLQLVVFPRTQLPLHIFEERYKEMIGEVMRERSEFGIVLAKEGGIANAGCTVMVDKVVTEYPDGRLDIMTMGRRRFEIVYLNQDRTFLRGQVEFFDDEEEGSVAPELRLKALENYRELAASGEARAYGEPALNDPQLSFQLAQALQDLDFQTVLLRSRSEADRLRQLAEFLEEQLPRLRQKTRIKQLAPLNGHGHRPAKL